MSDLEHVLELLRTDSEFAQRVASEPAQALREFQLNSNDLTAIEQALNGGTSPAPTVATSASGVKALTIAAAVMVAAGCIGLGLRIGMHSTPAAPADPLRISSIHADLFGCPSISSDPNGSLRAGDRVWVIGRTSPDWLVIRTPDAFEQPSWIRAAALEVTPKDLPELNCSNAVDQAQRPPAVETTGATATAPGPTEPTLATTTTSVTSDTTVPVPAPNPSNPASTTPTAPTPTGPASTAPSTSALPAFVVTVTPNSQVLFMVHGGGGCTPTSLEVTVSSNLGFNVNSLTATWPGGGTAAVTALGANKYRLEAFTRPPASSTTMTITAVVTAADGRTATGTSLVELRAPEAYGCIG